MNEYALIMHNVDCIRNEHSAHYRGFKSDDMHIQVHLHCSLRMLSDDMGLDAHSAWMRQKHHLTALCKCSVWLDVSSHLRMKQVVNQCLADRTKGDLQVPQDPEA